MFTIGLLGASSSAYRYHFVRRSLSHLPALRVSRARLLPAHSRRAMGLRHRFALRILRKVERSPKFLPSQFPTATPTVVYDQLNTTVGASGNQSGSKASKDTADPDCISKQETAGSICNTMGSAGMDPAQGAMMEFMMNQAINQASQISATGANQSQQCATQAKIAELMAGVNAIKAAACATAQHLCSDTCSSASAKVQTQIDNLPSGSPPSTITPLRTQIVADDRHGKLCSSYSINTMMAAMQAMQFGSSYLQDNACAAATAATPSLLDPNAGQSLVSSTDCSDPTVAQTNVSCICAANPTNAICGNQSTALGGGTGALGASGPGSAPRPTDVSTASDGIVPTGLGSPTPETGVAAASGNGSGGGLAGGNPAGAAAGGDGAAGEGPVDKSSVITGAGSGGGGGGLGAPGNPAGAGNANGAGGFLDKFNLSKFLPSKKDAKFRGLAGMQGKAVDGITGAMGPSIWEKVTNQYQAQKLHMIQDR